MKRPMTAIVTDENVAAAHLATLERALAATGHPLHRHHHAAGRGHQELQAPGRTLRQAAGGGHRAARPHHRLRRRRHRRSRGLCRGDPAARGGLHPDPDDAARPGRFLRRRQDRHQLAPRQEPDRRLPPAARRHHRHRPARHAAAARTGGGLCRGGEIRPARRCRLLRMAGRRGTRHHARRRAGAHPRHPQVLRGQGRTSSRRTRRRRACARCSTSATPSAMRSNPPPAIRSACCMARASRSAWCRPSASPSARSSARPARRTAWRST